MSPNPTPGADPTREEAARELSIAFARFYDIPAWDEVPAGHSARMFWLRLADALLALAP